MRLFIARKSSRHQPYRQSSVTERNWITYFQTRV